MSIAGFFEYYVVGKISSAIFEPVERAQHQPFALEADAISLMQSAQGRRDRDVVELVGDTKHPGNLHQDDEGNPGSAASDSLAESLFCPSKLFDVIPDEQPHDDVGVKRLHAVLQPPGSRAPCLPESRDQYPPLVSIALP
ncbi:MAG TPA: hypothetical protein VJQ57_04160, partial [Acidimicrobiia bacterium]|nr:hypothetical protein [Acidimicrobiia bacterium]